MRAIVQDVYGGADVLRLGSRDSSERGHTTDKLVITLDAP